VTHVSAVVIFHVLSERRTRDWPYLQRRQRREYYVEPGASAFDPMLAEIDPNWPEHLRRTPD